MALVLPIVVQMGSQQFMAATDLVFLGHLGRFELAVGTLASTLFSLLWFGIAGFGTAFDTLGSQSHGAGDHVATRNWAALLVLGLSACCLPAAAVLASGGDVASVVLAQDEETSLAVGRFCGVLIIGLWPAALTLAVQKFLQVRNDVVPVALTSFAAFVANVGLNWYYIRRAGLGLVGSALATSTSRVLNLVLVAAYVRFDRKSWRAIVRPSVSGTHADDGDEWDAIEVEARGGAAAGGAWRSLRAEASDRTSLLAALTDRDAIRKMCRLGSRGAAMVAAEASSFDVTVVFASQLSQVALDAHVAMLNVCSLTFMTGPMAFGIAANVRVGNLLGAADPARAALAARVSVGIGIAWMAACALVIVAFRSRVGELFVGKDDAEVIDLVRNIAPVAAVFQIFDGALGTCNGVLRACGKQSLLARVNVGALWGIGVLLGFILTFPVEMGVLGLWIGLAAGVCAGGFVLAAVAAGLDWDDEAAKASASADAFDGATRALGVGGRGDSSDDEGVALVDVSVASDEREKNTLDGKDDGGRRGSRHRRRAFRQTPAAAVEGTFGMGPGGETDDVVCGVIDAAPMSEEARIADRDRRAREAELLEWTPDAAGRT
jgi:MATE family multidrug resistance protein